MSRAAIVPMEPAASPARQALAAHLDRVRDARDAAEALRGDGTTLSPNGVFPAQVPAAFVVDLLAAGWTLNTSTGGTHIP